MTSGGGLCSLVELLILEDNSKDPSGDSCENRILPQAEDHQKPERTAVQSRTFGLISPFSPQLKPV